MLDVRYAYYALIDAKLSRHAGGAAQPLITQTGLRDAEIPTPPLDIQRRIASILSAYDHLIEINTRRIAILEEMARRLFEEWFIQFKFPGHTDIDFVETPGGRVPVAWSGHSLSEIVDFRYGKALKANDRVPGPVPVYGSSGIVRWHNESLVEGPGIIVGRKGNVGSVHWSREPFYPIDTVFYVSTSWPKTFVYHVLQNQHFLNSDSAVPGLNRGQALRAYINILPMPLAVEFDRHGSEYFQLMTKFEDINEKLRASRDLLLPRLISGEIDLTGYGPEIEQVHDQVAAE